MGRVVLAFAVMVALANSSEAKVSYRGGDGSSIAKAVKIVGARNGFEGVRSEYVWLARNKPTCRRGSQTLLNKGRKMYDLLTIRCGGRAVNVYFDITNFFGKY